ncbi:DUF302 domain-containing protein [Nocardioides houyundeii]|uniref:DUF302 domain-containing protein n=1 Tax=Nocardioides houyundeii TaxID=2045452 RepID=UPI000C765A61|nr:DUF302 domain-containing protein [Nocardioides houyundeii]
MGSYTIAVKLSQRYEHAVEAVRSALAEQGFGILTEIDLQATFKTKLGVDVAPQVILGACRPALAHEALRAEPSIAAVLPCNVVVRALDDATTLVEAFDPEAMMGLADSPALRTIADDAKQRITAALASLDLPEEDD